MTLTLRDLAFVGGGGALWTPAQLGASLALWLDCADASTLVLNAGNVSQWSDKSGLSRHATQAIAASQPALVSGGPNSQTVISSQNQRFLLTLAFAGALDITIWIAERAVSRPTLVPVPYCWGNINAEWSFIHNTDERYGWRTPGDIFTPASTSWRILNGQSYRGTNNVVFWVNGVSQGSRTQSITYSTSTRQLGIGRAVNGPGNHSDVRIAEIVLAHGVQTAADRERMEGYLAHKWWGAGAANTLAAGHPFKSAAPTV